MTYQLHHGNCLDIMPLIERESVDAIVTDPPYGLGFMGKDWDHGVPGEHFWREAYRVAKPGAHLLAFGGTRTFHRLAVAIEDAGWEMRDTVMWVYGQGFPKSHDVSKAIDREAGAEREVIGKRTLKGNAAVSTKEKGGTYIAGASLTGVLDIDVTIPSTESAQEWDGWGTALKPAWEPIIVARKPLQGTVAENVQRYGTGAMNIDGCRIGYEGKSIEQVKKEAGNPTKGQIMKGWKATENYKPIEFNPQGRWPANLIHDGSAEVLAGFPQSNSAGSPSKTSAKYKAGESSIFHGQASSWFGDTGSAARFFYCAKASKADRDEGLEGIEARETAHGIGDWCEACGKTIKHNGSGEGCQCGDNRIVRHAVLNNHHPTVKPTALMRYLCKLVTPPNGVILDPFMGSGSTGKAAMLEGFNFIGIDTEIEYVEIAARRIEHACEKVGIVIDQPMLFDTKRETVDKPKQLMLL